MILGRGTLRFYQATRCSGFNQIISQSEAGKKIWLSPIFLKMI